MPAGFDFYSDGELPGKENMSALNACMALEEKVQKFVESGNLAPHEVALYILAHGSTGQKISMVQHLGRTFKECDEKKVTLVVNELNESMWTQDLELQVAAPVALSGILGMFNEAQLLLLLSGAKAMLEVKTEQVRQAWSTLLLDLVVNLPTDALVKLVVPLALKKGEHSEPHDQRVFGCHCIGRLCRKLSADTIVQTVLNKAINLCQDTDTNVRVAMCGQLGEVARAIGLDRTKDKITAELFELLVDEEKLVSRAAFTSLIDLVEFFDPPYRREHFYPIIKSYVTSPPEEVLSLLVDEFGRFLWKIKSDIQGAEDVTLFANFFRQSAQKSDAEVRRLCAYNLPAVVASLPPSVYSTHLAQVQRALAVDAHPATRRAIAAGMHELCTLLGDKAAQYLKESFLALIQDASLEVRTVIVSHLSAILACFNSQLKGDERDAFFVSVAPHICNYEKAVRRDWRKVSALFDGFPDFPKYFSGAIIHDQFMPLFMVHLFNGAAAIKDQCAGLVVQFSKSLGSNALIVEAFSKMVSDFGRSQSCFNRMTYCLLFKHCAAAYSRRLIRDRLLEPLLDLAKDPVPNVRIQLAHVLPLMRRTLKPTPPSTQPEPEHVNLFSAALQRMKNDPDQEVQAAMQVALKEIEDLESEIARHVALRMTNAPDDIRDRELDQAEGDLLEVAKEQEKIERKQRIREMLRNDNGGVDPALPRVPGGKTAGTARRSLGPPAPAPKAAAARVGGAARASSNTRLPTVPTRR